MMDAAAVARANRRAFRVIRRRAARLARCPPLVLLPEQFDWPAGFNPGSGALLAINEDLAKSYDALAYVANNVLNMQHTRTALRGVLDMKSWGKATQCLWKVLEDMRDEALLKLAKCEKDYNRDSTHAPCSA
ncbi:hypothetical protein PVAP13_5KG419607 [Panicum virgatum]|uniref:Uncharacterized protein n=1 Tax=Panicum virgatum TaxID=38727 RepID=A0A8T0SUJ7_PANVG|nr:hypothetical protein PVAP13_5KG419607 [Panicum virgatum]